MGRTQYPSQTCHRLVHTCCRPVNVHCRRAHVNIKLELKNEPLVFPRIEETIFDSSEMVLQKAT